METYGIEKYGITGTTEIVHNPSYELLYNEDQARPGRLRGRSEDRAGYH